MTAMQRRQNSILNRDENYEAVDPFKPSVAFSLKNLFSKRVQQRAEDEDEDNLTSLPKARQRDGKGRIPPRRDVMDSGAHWPEPLVPGTAPVTMHAPMIPPVIPQPRIIQPQDFYSPIPAQYSHVHHPPQRRSTSRSSSPARGRPSSVLRDRSRRSSRDFMRVTPPPLELVRPAWRPVHPRRYVSGRNDIPQRRRSSSHSRSPDRRTSVRRSPVSTHGIEQVPDLNTTHGEGPPPVLISASPDHESSGGHPQTPSRVRSSITSQLSYVESRSRPISMRSSLSQIDLSSPFQDIVPESIAMPQRSPSPSLRSSRSRHRQPPVIVQQPTVIAPYTPDARRASRSRDRSRDRHSSRARRSPPHLPPLHSEPFIVSNGSWSRTSSSILDLPNIVPQFPPASVPVLPISAPPEPMPPIVISITPTEAASYRSRSRSRRRASPISLVIGRVSLHSPSRHRSRSRTPPRRHRSRRSRRSSSSTHYSPIRSHPIVVPMPTSRRTSSSPPRSYGSSRRRTTRCCRSRSPRSRSRGRTRSRSRSRTRSPYRPPVIIQQPSVVIAPPLMNEFPVLAPSRVSITKSYASGKTSTEWFRDAPSVQRSTYTLDNKWTKWVSIPEIKQEESKESFLSQTWPYLFAFIIDTIPRQIYLHLLLRLPYLYFTRVSRIFEEAEMSIPEIKQGILETAQKQKDLVPHMATAWAFEPPVVSEPYQNLNKTWTVFIDSLLKEWKTLNIISVLLLTAILTILQLDGAGTDPLTRFTALISMICALMSLLFGCMYIIRFGTMRKTYKAAEWACEAKRTRTGIFWNVWVMLAMPAAWLAWSMISYIVCVMSFVWRTGTLSDTNREPFSDDVALVPRIVVTVVLSLGLIYFFLIALTLRRYGALMDRAWQRRIQGWIFELEAPLYQKSNNPSMSKLPINTIGMPTYPEEKVAAYKADEKLYPAFQSEPVYPVLQPVSINVPPQHPSVSVPKREMKSAMGPGSKNCGIHWDSKAKVGSSVVSIYPESEIKPTSGVDTVVEPSFSGFSTLFAGSTNLYASVRPPTPPPRKKQARSTSLGANNQDDDDDDCGSIVCRFPAGRSDRGSSPTPPSQTGSGFEGVTILCRYSRSPSSPSISESNSRQELSRSTMCYTHLLDRDKTAAKLAKEAQEKKPLIRMTRLVGLSDGGPPFSIPPTEHDLERCGLKIDLWKELHKDAHKNWKLNPESEAMNKDHTIHAFIAQWNKTYSAWSQHQIQLCEERSEASPNGSFAIYHFKLSEELPYDDTRYDVSGLDVQRVDVLGPFRKVRDDDVELRRLSLFATHLYIGDELLRENVLEASNTKGGDSGKPELEVTSLALVAEESDESSDSDD